jgi:putative ABC transport system ATP-binding protein
MITLEAITKSYPVKQERLSVLNQLSLSIHQADFISLLGRSGQGKSTLLNILGGFDTFDSGQYTFDGASVEQLTPTQLAAFRSRHIGFIFQSFHLIKHLTVQKNVELPLLLQRLPEPQRQQRAVLMLKRLGLREKSHCYPRQLSGGQCQRVAIARALVTRPQLILADEPTGSLDRETADTILNLFKELNQEGHTIVMVTHDPLVAKRASRVLQLEQGVLRSAA